ncbi:glycosyl hydrolase family 47 protein [Phyllosticta citricarpa]|uniref:alpha-1,2-Mannosidase n=2 Tax=Phyllosticta TaxID=121621 RepID=A0ABR1L7M7_9PEZI
MLRLTRRWLLIGILAAFSILFLYLSFHRERGASLASDAPAEPPPPAPDTPEAAEAQKKEEQKTKKKKPYKPQRFDWTRRGQRFPVEFYHQLPRGKHQELPKIQSVVSNEDNAARTEREGRRQEVKSTFERAWKAYKAKAWLADELTPLTGNSRTSSGWAATLIESLDTLWIMGMHEDFEKAVNAALRIDFQFFESEIVNIYEVTIRHLGGLLAAYDLSGDERLLKKALELGDMLYVAFDTPERMPLTRWKPHDALYKKVQFPADSILVVEVTSMALEFTRLSQASGNPKYFDATERVIEVIEKQQNKTRLPGMWPLKCNAKVKDFTADPIFTLGEFSGTTYENLPKIHLLLNGLTSRYRDLYTRAMDTAVKHLLFRPLVPNNRDLLALGHARIVGNRREGEEIRLEPEWQNHVCFAGGMFALGGRLFNQSEHVDIGRKITDACIWTHQAFPLGIMPETSSLVPCAKGSAAVHNESSDMSCSWSELKWRIAVQKTLELDSADELDERIAQENLQPGFASVADKRHLLRPEAVESIFVLYRITGMSELHAIAWQMFEKLRAHTEAEWGNAAVEDVTTSGKPTHADVMATFWMSGTLKYFYLLFSEPELFSLDDFVFNTEAHPFRIPKPPTEPTPTPTAA